MTRVTSSRPAPTVQTLQLSVHAAEQYQQRVKPGLDLAAARAELEQLLPAGQITEEPPAWLRSAGRTPYYLIISDAVALPLTPQQGRWIATTCVTQTTLTQTRRAAKSTRKASLAVPQARPAPHPLLSMIAAQTIAGGDTTANTVLGLAVLLLLAGALLRLVRAYRRQPHARAARVGALLHRLRGRPALSTGRRRGSEDQANPEATAARPLPEPPPPPTPPPAGAGGDARSAPRGDRPPAHPEARLSPETLEPVAQFTRWSRRLAIAEARVGEALDGLPRDRWLVERYVMIGGRRIPFLILGETGVFTLWPRDSQPPWDDLQFAGNVASIVKANLPGYTGPVHPGICQALGPDVKPRWWYRAELGVGGWVMGLDSLIPWLNHFGPEHGIGVKDIERFRDLAAPHGNGARVLPVRPGIPTTID